MWGSDVMMPPKVPERSGLTLRLGLPGIFGRDTDGKCLFKMYLSILFIFSPETILILHYFFVSPSIQDLQACEKLVLKWKEVFLGERCHSQISLLVLKDQCSYLLGSEHDIYVKFILLTIFVHFYFTCFGFHIKCTVRTINYQYSWS